MSATPVGVWIEDTRNNFAIRSGSSCKHKAHWVRRELDDALEPKCLPGEQFNVCSDCILVTP